MNDSCKNCLMSRSEIKATAVTCEDGMPHRFSDENKARSVCYDTKCGICKTPLERHSNNGRPAVCMDCKFKKNRERANARNKER